MQELAGIETDEDEQAVNRQPMKDLLAELEGRAADDSTQGDAIQEDGADSGAREFSDVPENDSVIAMPAGLAAPRRKTIIAEGTIVRGPIEAAGGVELYGEMQGTLSSVEEIMVSGKLTGDSSSRAMEMRSGRIKGDVTAVGRVQIDEASILLGNVKADEVQLGGKIRGDLDVQRLVALEQHAVVLGSITAQSLSVAEGAAMQGELRIAAHDINAAFQDEIL